MTILSLPTLIVLSPSNLEFPGGSQLALMLMRWIHITAGIVWVGLLYFFNLVNFQFLRELDPKTRTVVVPNLMPKALWWFRWSSVVTVLVGVAWWMHIVASDVRMAVANGLPASSAMISASFFLIWTLAFAIEMGVLMAPADALKKGPVLGVIVALVVFGASYLFLSLNQQGWESARSLAIGVGGGLGWFMMLNVWGIIWRLQKKIIRWNAAAAQGEAMPPEAAKIVRLVFLTSRVNFWLSFPMLFFMSAASHYLMKG